MSKAPYILARILNFLTRAIQKRNAKRNMQEIRKQKHRLFEINHNRNS